MSAAPPTPFPVFSFLRAVVIGLSISPLGSTAEDAPELQRPGGELLQTFLAGPLSNVEHIVFAMRPLGEDPHWYANFGYWCSDPERKMYPVGGKLCRLNLRSGELEALVDDPRGGVRDPQVHYDGKKILFSYRRGGQENYHLYEIDVDGRNLRQLTDGPDDDVEPTYLPDGNIIFGSSRCNRFVNCWHTRVATLYRCDGDGKDVRMISSNNDHDNTPWVLPDGRVLYMRWEYVDRSQVHFHHLWTVNPDGTKQMVYYGNQNGGIAMLDAKPIPGSEKVVASFSPGHGRKEHMGYVTIVDPGSDPDDLGAAKQVSKRRELYRDPYALSEDCFLVAGRQGIFVMDGEGNAELIYSPSSADGALECHEPRPLRARARERVLPSFVDPSKENARLIVTDIYEGRNMDGIQRGDIKKLLVLEQLPEPVHFSGGMEPLTIGGTFTMARILGTVPVEPDGSAHFEVPALRSVFFVALDENDLSVKRMQSFVTMQPGEVTSCGGCHERRSQATKIPPRLQALSRAASRIQPIDDVPDVFDFPRDIQPILDRNCVACHNSDRREGRVNLSGDHTPKYTISYWTMVKHRLVADGRNQPYSNRAPRTIGSSASRLMKLIDGSHHGATLSARERTMVRLWIETSATYPGTYAALGCGMYPVRLPQRALERCIGCHASAPGQRRKKESRKAPLFGGVGVVSSMCNLTRPKYSLLLRAPLVVEAGGLGLCSEDVFAGTNDPAYRALLAAIEASAAELEKSRRFDMPGFRPNEHYVREMQRFGILAPDLKPEDPIDVYATDRLYWESFWYRPEKRIGVKTVGSF